jgi:hypothetical protein
MAADCPDGDEPHVVAKKLAASVFILTERLPLKQTSEQTSKQTPLTPLGSAA